MYIISVLGNCGGLKGLADKAVADQREFTVLYMCVSCAYILYVPISSMCGTDMAVCSVSLSKVM